MIYHLRLYRNCSFFRVFFWIAFIFFYIAAVLPQDTVPTIGPLSDKAQHILAFIVLGILLRFGYKINYWTGLLILVSYGVFIEFSQLFAVNRFAEIEDIIADMIGAFIGLKLYEYLRKVLECKR